MVKKVSFIRVLICSTGYNTYHKTVVDVFQWDQANALMSYGHDVRVVTLDLRSIRRVRSWKSSRIIENGIHVYTVNRPCGRLPSAMLDPIGKAAARKVFSMACDDGWKPDIIHAHFTDMAYYFADVAKDNCITFVVTEHNSAMNCENVSIRTLRMAMYAYERADKLIAVSKSLADSIKKHTGFNAYVIFNIIDTSIFRFADNGECKRSSFNFISAGALIHGKGMDILLSAFSHIDSKDAQLIIMGGGEELMSLRQQAERFGIADRVTFFGKYKRSEFDEQLRGADCFVLASRGETFGVVYIEAMATGVPVIGTICGGPEEFITSESGLLVAVNDIDGLTKAMNTMLMNASGYDRRKIAIYTKERFAPEQIAAQIGAIYEQVKDD